MPKSTSFSLRNRKNRPALKVLPPDTLCLQRLKVSPQTFTLTLSRYECFAIRV